MRARLLQVLTVWTAIVLVVGVVAVATDSDDPTDDVVAAEPPRSEGRRSPVASVPATAPATTASTTPDDESPNGRVASTTASPAPSEVRSSPTTVAPAPPSTAGPGGSAGEPATTTTTAPSGPDPAPPTSSTTTVPAPAPAPESQDQPRSSGDVLLVWTSGGLRDGYAEAIASIESVTAFTTVWGDLVKLSSTADAAGATVDRAPDGWAFPIDVFAIDPASYASFQDRDGSSGARDVLAALEPGEAVLTQTSAALRRLGVGGTLTVASGATLHVHGIVPDVDGGGAEVLIHRADAAAVGVDDERFMLLSHDDRAATEAEIRRRTPSDLHLSVRSEDEAPYLRHGDRVDPQILVKRTFGEFVFQDAGGRDIRIDPAWIDANIVTEEVPLLGRIRCHRAIVPKVRAAMERVRDAGAGDSVNPRQYAGCHNPRRIGAGAGLSRHTWGLALDINVGDNPRGDYETQHPELVAAMRDQGFNWGGDWEYPDPAHYEARA